MSTHILQHFQNYLYFTGEKNYEDLDVLDKLSFLSLALLHCVLKYRVSGKILHDDPQV
jgi:hypothetical protein